MEVVPLQVVMVVGYDGGGRSWNLPRRAPASASLWWLESTSTLSMAASLVWVSGQGVGRVPGGGGGGVPGHLGDGADEHQGLPRPALVGIELPLHTVLAKQTRTENYSFSSQNFD